MPTIVRKKTKTYRWEVGHAPLSAVANVERMMPKNYISRDGMHITKACRDYLLPLIKGEAYPPYKDGLPQYVKLNNKGVRKKLKTKFEI
jgi:6-phosphofructokinase 1